MCISCGIYKTFFLNWTWVFLLLLISLFAHSFLRLFIYAHVNCELVNMISLLVQCYDDSELHTYIFLFIYIPATINHAAKYISGHHVNFKFLLGNLTGDVFQQAVFNSKRLQLIQEMCTSSIKASQMQSLFGSRLHLHQQLLFPSLTICHPHYAVGWPCMHIGMK